jgi:hypothetical protein
MSPLTQFDRETRHHPPHSSHSNSIYSDVPAARGVPLRCQFCASQSFRRSSLRAADLGQLLLMRYPVRCLRCGQRQMVSFTVAGISIAASIKLQKTVNTAKHWSELPKEREPSSTGRPDQPTKQSIPHG